MIKFYQRVPALSVRHEIDGKEYVNSDAALVLTKSHRATCRINQPRRLLKVAFIRNGEAYVYLGCAGDKIAVITNLPISIEINPPE